MSLIRFHPATITLYFLGAGTTKDVTGIGVQRELLKLLENTDLVVPFEFGHSTSEKKS